MARAGWITGLVVAAFIAGARVGMAEDTSAPAAHSSRAIETANMKIDRKLDQILSNQNEILKRFDLIMEELRVIKVRATRSI